MNMIFLIVVGMGLLVLLNRTADRFPQKVRPWIHWVHAQVFELVTLVVLMILYVGSFFYKSREPVGGLHGRPILLVHGYLNAGFVFLFYKKMLAKKGFGPIYTIDLGSPFHSIRYFAQEVHRMAQKIAKETGRSDLTLIGHSMGGLVATYYAISIAPQGSVSQVITIASPLKGTKVAKIGIGVCAREMEMGSSLIREVDEALGHSTNGKFYHIATQTDELIVPYSSSFLDQSTNRYLLPDVGHAALLFSYRVVRQISHWLTF